MDNKVVIVVLGGGVQANLLNKISKLRLKAALKIFNTEEKILIFSGGVSFLNQDKPKTTEAQLMFDEAKGVLGSDDGMFIEDQSVDTISNAYYSRKIIDKLNIDHLTVVTSSTHVPRAKWIFEKVFNGEQSNYFISVESVTDEVEEKIIVDESKLLKFTQEWMLHLPDGDMDAIGNFLQTEHPGYASKTKNTTETFKRLIAKPDRY